MHYQLFTPLSLPIFNKDDIYNSIDLKSAKVISAGTSPSDVKMNVKFDVEDQPKVSKIEHCIPSYIRYPIKNITFLQQWLEVNIPELSNTKVEIGYQEIKHTVKSEKEATVLPHTDGPARKFLLMYLFSTGNEISNVDTVWWNKENVKDGPHHILFTFDGLTEVARATFSTDQWVMLYAHKFHTVHSIIGNRSSLTIGFNDDHTFNTIKEKYGK